MVAPAMPNAKPTKATSVADYLAQLPDDRRQELERVRQVVRKHVPKGYEECISFGLIAWVVPLSRYPDTYNGQPLMYAALGTQKNYLSLYLMGPYGSPELLKKLKEGFAAAGKKLDMGKSCVRFKRADDLDLPTIGRVIAAVPADRWVEIARSARRR
jgi:uncharacterized protein YdhG (YjbR/CyaY superfamily)